MTNFIIAIFLSILFLYGLNKISLIDILKNIGNEVLQCFQLLLDKSSSDLQKEKKLRERSTKIFIKVLEFFSKLAILLLLIIIIVIIFDNLNIVSKRLLVKTLFSIEFLIIISILLFIFAIGVKKNNKKKGLDNFSLGDKFIHYFAFSSPIILKFFYNLEEFFIKDKLKDENYKIIFITTLARGGSTALLNAINSSKFISCHTYRDMPFLTMPNLWNFISGGKRRSVDKINRAHADGHKIDLDSPEAFEEVIWKIFWPEKYNTSKIGIIDEHFQNKKFKRFFTNHIKKIIQLKNKNKKNNLKKNLYYCSKNNNNFTRIKYLKDLYSHAFIIIPIREPLSHANSLLKQHKHFSYIQTKNRFILDYMTDIGHYEFGLNHRPFNFNKFNLNNYDKNSINYWLEYWICSYSHIFQNYDKCIFVSLEDLVNSPNSSMKIIFKKIGLELPAIDFSIFFKKSENNLTTDAFDKELYDRALKIYNKMINLKITKSI